MTDTPTPADVAALHSQRTAIEMEDNLAAAQQRLLELEHAELINRISLEHRLPSEDRVLLRGPDEATLIAQAERLSQMTREAVVRRTNVAPREGSVLELGKSHDRELREFTSDLFQTDDWWM